MKTSKNFNIQFSLPVTILKEGECYVAYTPALDLSTSGKSFSEAKKRFQEVVCLFIEELIEKQTLDKVLMELGWEKIKKEWVPPVVIASETQKFDIPLSCPN